MLKGALVLASALAVASAGPFDPGVLPVAPHSGKVGNDAKWNYRVSAPEVAGKYPILIYITGGGGVVPAFLYSNLTDSIAAKGVVVVTLSRLALPAPRKNAKLLDSAVEWLQAGNLDDIASPAVGDWDKLTLGAHSAGNHINCNYLQTSCGDVKGVVMMDPVDGYDPWGVVDNYCITPGEKVNFTVPALLLRCGLDPVKKTLVACAPDRIANQRFYDAWRGPIWEANATQLGHADLLNPGGSGSMGGLICPSGEKEANVVDYIRQVTGLTKAFLDLIFGDASAEGVLTKAGGMLVETVTNHEYNGNAPPFAGKCTHL